MSRRGWSEEDIADHVQTHGTDLDKQIYEDEIAELNRQRAEGDHSYDISKGRRPVSVSHVSVLTSLRTLFSR